MQRNDSQHTARAVTAARRALDRRISRLALALVLACFAPLMYSGKAIAQAGCTTIQPPCDPMPVFAIELSIAGGDTVSTATPTATAYVQGLTNANSASSGATITITTAANVTLTFEANGHAAYGSGTLSLAAGWNSITATYADGVNGGRSISRSVYYLAPPPAPTRSAPIATPEPGSLYQKTFGGCAGCAYTTLSYSTPSYRSFGQDRSLTLLYSSATSAPTGLLVLDVNPNSTQAPDQISLALLDPEGQPVTLSNGQQEIFYAGGAGTSRISAQFDAAAYRTLTYQMTAIVRNRWSDGTVLQSSLPVRVFIANGQPTGFGNEFGRGWEVAGLQHLFGDFQGNLLVSESGTLLTSRRAPAADGRRRPEKALPSNGSPITTSAGTVTAR